MAVSVLIRKVPITTATAGIFNYLFVYSENISLDISCELSDIAFAQADLSLHYPPEDALYPLLSTECLAKTDQTARMRRLISVFAGRYAIL